MPQCNECKFYKPIDDEKGNCFGQEIPGNMDVNKCPVNAYRQK